MTRCAKFVISSLSDAEARFNGVENIDSPSDNIKPLRQSSNCDTPCFAYS